MTDQNQTPPAPPSEERRAQFAPHHNPRKQPDGDPGPNSTQKRAVDERGAETPERVEDKRAED